MHYLRNIGIKIKSKIKQTRGLTEIAALKIRSKRNPSAKPRKAWPKTTGDGCQSPTACQNGMSVQQCLLHFIHHGTLSEKKRKNDKSVRRNLRWLVYTCTNIVPIDIGQKYLANRDHTKVLVKEQSGVCLQYFDLSAANFVPFVGQCDQL